MSDDYKVGYKKPPKKSQFKKGQSGNPKGRPKGRKNNHTILSESLSQKVTVTRDGKKLKISRIEALNERGFQRAMQGNANDWDRYMNFLNRAGQLREKTEETEQESGVLMIPAAPETKEQWEAWAYMQQAPHRGESSHGAHTNSHVTEAAEATNKPGNDDE